MEQNMLSSALYVSHLTQNYLGKPIDCETIEHDLQKMF